VFAQQGAFFGAAALVTFGGAYAVLAYVAQGAVETYGWLSPGEMLDGLALAETTPGPLIMVVQYVAFIAAFRHPGGLSPYAAGVLGSLLTTWVTFMPCFLWIFLGAPYIEALRRNRTLSAALSAITAAVVGVILNLSVWFAVHTVFHSVQMQTIGLMRANRNAALQAGDGLDVVRQRCARCWHLDVCSRWMRRSDSEMDKRSTDDRERKPQWAGTRQ
jgi:chromate transporter